MGSFFQFSIIKIGTLCFLPSPLCGEMGGRGLKHCKTQYFWHLDFRRGFPGAQEAQAASQLLPVWVHYLGSMFNYPGENEAAGRRLGFLDARETPPKIKVPKVLCFTVLKPATTHFAAECHKVSIFTAEN